MVLVVKSLPANAGDIRDAGSIPRSGRSPGEGHSNSLQYSCLESPIDRGAQQATVHNVAQSRTWLKWLSTHAVNKCLYSVQFSLVQFSCSVVSDSLWPHELQHARPPWPSPTPRAYPNSCPLSRWCHPTISSSVVPFSSCPHSFLASGSFLMSQLFT